MRAFDTVVVVDWSAAQGVKRAGKDAIWAAVADGGEVRDPVHFALRAHAETWMAETMRGACASGRRVLIALDFPFGYPAGFARGVTGSDDPALLWDWLEARITDDATGRNNRYDVAETLNALFPGIGPFWGKPNRSGHPGIPFGGRQRAGHGLPERRACDKLAKASSTCWQLAFPPTVGGQALMGLPMVARLRRMPGAAVWPFEDWHDADAVLAEIGRA